MPARARSTLLRAPQASGRRAPRRDARAAPRTSRRGRRSSGDTLATRARPRPESGSRSTARSSSSSAATARFGVARRRAPRPARTRIAHRVGRLTRRCRELGRTRPRQRDDEVETIEQRPRQPLAVAVELLRRARAARPAHRRGRRRGRGSSSRRAGSAPGRASARRPGRSRPFRPRAAGAEPRAPERGNSGSSSSSRTPWCASVDLARPGARAAADDRGGRGGVVRRSEGRRSDQPGAGRQQAGDRVDPRDLERRLVARAAAGSRAAGARASSCRSRAARRAGGCGRRRRRSRAPSCARSWPRTSAEVGPARAGGRPRGAVSGCGGLALDRGSTPPPRRDGVPAPARSPRARPRRRTRPRRRAAASRSAARPRPLRARRGRVAAGRRGRARRSRRARPGSRAGSGVTPRAAPARSAGRSPSPPCAGRPERG